MRAAVLRDQRFTVEQIARPVPGPGQVLARTRACGICGSDLHLFKHGADIAKLGEELGAPREDLSAGLILGHEFVAEIVEFGPGTERRLPVGQRVLSVPFLMSGDAVLPIGATTRTGGAYAEYLLLSEALLLPVPDSLSDEGAALTEPLAIGVHAVAKAAMGADDAAAVVGCGPIGLAVIAVLRQRGVRHIVAADLSPKRRELAATMGATDVVNPAQAGSAVERLKQLAPGAPAVVFECTGARGMIERIIREAPMGTRIVVAGICSGADTFTPMVAISKEITLQFVVYYQPAEFAEALGALASGSIRWQPLVTGRIGLAGVADAFKALEDPETHAKIIIDPRI